MLEVVNPPQKQEALKDASPKFCIQGFRDATLRKEVTEQYAAMKKNYRQQSPVRVPSQVPTPSESSTNDTLTATSEVFLVQTASRTFRAAFPNLTV
jgi:hypothetical protein